MTTTEKFEYLKSHYDYIPRKAVDDIIRKPMFVIDGTIYHPIENEYEWDWIERIFDEFYEFEMLFKEFVEGKNENL